MADSKKNVEEQLKKQLQQSSEQFEQLGDEVTEAREEYWAVAARRKEAEQLFPNIQEEYRLAKEAVQSQLDAVAKAIFNSDLPDGHRSDSVLIVINFRNRGNHDEVMRYFQRQIQDLRTAEEATLNETEKAKIRALQQQVRDAFKVVQNIYVQTKNNIVQSLRPYQEMPLTTTLALLMSLEVRSADTLPKISDKFGTVDSHSNLYRECAELNTHLTKMEDLAKERMERLERQMGKVLDDKHRLEKVLPQPEPVSPRVFTHLKRAQAIETQTRDMKPLVDIITTLQKSNNEQIKAYEIGTKKISNRAFRFSPLADTGAKFKHATERAKDLERLLRGAKTLSYEDLQSRLEEHLAIYQQQEIQDRAIGGGFKKGSVQKMLDTAKESLKKIEPASTSAPNQPRPRSHSNKL